MKNRHSDTLLYRCDPGRNMDRFYALSIEVDLFGQFLAVRRWGRIGTRGRSLFDVCSTEQEALALIRRRLELKRRRGYMERRPGGL